MESSTPPNTTTTTTLSVPEQISENVTASTSSHSKTTISTSSTTSVPLSTLKPFFIPTEKDKEKPLVPGIISFPLPLKLFGETSEVPFKFSMFDLPKAFSSTKDSGSSNLFSGQNPGFTSGIFSKFSADKYHQPAPLFSQSFADPKADKEITSTNSESASSTSKTAPLQGEITRHASGFSFASSPITESLFSKNLSPQVFGKNLEKNKCSKLFQKIEKEKKSDDKGNPIKGAKGVTNSDKSLPSTSTENRHHIASQMDVKHLTTIICKGLHSDDNKRDVLLHHFSKFGKVTKITCSINQKHAIIQFIDHESASKAKKIGSLISTVHNPVSIFWCQKGPSRNVKVPSSARSEVDDELKSMLEGPGEHDLLVRPPEKKAFPRVAERRPVKTTVKATKKITSKKQSKGTASPVAPTSTSAPEESWTKALIQIAHSPAEKFIVLDSRDKLMRQSLERRSDFKTNIICGTCPDMCPEKERYSRFTKNCLSLYEQSSDPLRLEHKVTIKEYSRSSADQEEPLPHELRPPETLAFTMDYLLCNIMDKAEESDMTIGEWYDFIWNRIRAIQKDIIQQDLCDTTCVEIVEKCVRFHIHCSAALCDKEMAVFDPKINNENLSKSLKTLKNFYTDLAMNEIICPNEPEFRAYDILLHLNEGNNTLRYVQNLRMEVRNSPEVRFAVSTAFAFTNNNYVRFFKFLNQATYFNACILHRYFAEIRLQALRTILKAYCRPNNTEQYPIEDLTILLKFENHSETIKFCEKVGLQILENNVIFDRLAFSLPTNSLRASQAPAVVGSKKRTSLGEAINHKPLPENPLHHYKPHNSFDENGYLKKEAYQGLDQFITKVPAVLSRNTFKLDTHSIPASTLPVVMALPQPPVFSMSSPKPVAFKPWHNLFKSVIVEPKLPIFPAVRHPVQPFIEPIISQEKEKITKQDESQHSGYDIQRKQEQLKQVDVVARESDTGLTQHSDKVFQAAVNSMLNHVIQEMVTHISISVYTEELQLQETIKKNAIKKISKTVLHELLIEVVQEEVINIVRQDVAFYRKEKIDNVSRMALKVFLEKSIASFVAQIAKEVYKTEQESWLTELDNARMKVMLSRVRTAFWRWHKASIRKRQMETFRNTFPSCPILQFTVRSHTSHLLSTPVEASAVQNINARLLESGVLCKAIKEELSWMPLDLTAIFENAFNNEIEFPLLSPTTNYWKVLLVYFEDDDLGPDFALISQWVCAKFSKGCEKVKPYVESKVCSLYWLTDLSNHQIAICVRSIAINCRTFQNNLSELKKTALLDGTVAILVCLPSKAVPNFSKGCHRQLEQLLETKANVPSVPLYSLMIGPNPSFYDIACNCLNNMQEKKLISDYEICTLNLQDDFYELSEKVSAAIDWLVQRCPKMPQFTTKYLKDYFQDGIVEVFNIIFEDISHKKNQNEFYEDPSVIISLFNESIKHRCSLVSSPSLNSISGPPPELVGYGKHSLSWKNPEFSQRLKSIMEACILPQFRGYPLFREDASTYVKAIVASANKNAYNLISSVNNLLRKSSRIGKKEFLIPWTDVIYECVQFLYSNQIYSEPTQEMYIIYLQEELESINLARRWKEISKSASILEFCENYVTHSTDVMSSACKRKLDNDDDCESSLTPTTSPSSEKRKKITELELSLKTEKENSDAFSSMLQQAMDPSENLSILLSPKKSEHVADNLGSSEPAFADCNSTENHEFSYSGDIVQQVIELKQNIESEKNATKALNSTLQALLL